MQTTKRHRELAMTAMGVELPLKHNYGINYIETGEDPSNIYPITKRFALTLAKLQYEQYLLNLADNE